MRNELSDRQQAIRMRLAGDSVALICQSLHRWLTWFHKWWQRYLAAGGEGLYDLTRARHAIVNRTPAHIERAILAIRRRLAARATPQTRYALLGAPTIAQELKNLGFTPVPTLRTIERVLQRAHLTSPRLRLAHHLPRSEYPSRAPCQRLKPSPSGRPGGSSLSHGRQDQVLLLHLQRCF